MDWVKTPGCDAQLSFTSYNAMGWLKGAVLWHASLYLSQPIKATANGFLPGFTLGAVAPRAGRLGFASSPALRVHVAQWVDEQEYVARWQAEYKPDPMDQTQQLAGMGKAGNEEHGGQRCQVDGSHPNRSTCPLTNRPKLVIGNISQQPLEFMSTNQQRMRPAATEGT